MPAIPVHDPAYRRMLPRVERAYVQRLAQPRRRVTEFAILGFQLWFLRSGVPYLRVVAKTSIPAEARGRAKQILAGEDNSLLAAAYWVTRRAYETGEYDSGEVQGLARAAVEVLREHSGDIEAVIALSLMAQLEEVEVPRRLRDQIVGRLDAESGLLRRGSKLFGLAVPTVGDEMDDVLIFVVNRPRFKAVEDNAQSPKTKGGNKRFWKRG